MASIITREAFSTALAEVMPKLAAAAVTLTPKSLREALGDSTGFGRWAMPIISTAFGAALSKVAGTLIGDKEMAAAIQDYMGDIRSVFTAEFGQALRGKHGEVLAKMPAGSADIVFPQSPLIVFIDPAHPDVCHHVSCTHLKRTTVIKGHPGDKDGKGKKPDQVVPRTDLMTEQLSRLPYTTIRHASCCAGLFVADSVMLAEQAVKLAKAAPKVAAEKGPASFLGFLGRARAGKIESISRADVEKLAGFFKQLTDAQLLELNEVDSDMELAALCLADDLPQFLSMVHAAKDRIQRNRWGEFLHLPPAAATWVKDGLAGAKNDFRTWSKDTAARIDKARIAAVAARPARVPPPPPAPPLGVRQSLRQLPGRLIRLAIHGTW